MAGLVASIFFAPEAGAQMKSVQAATALEGCGLKGDRYCGGTGHWSRFGRVCEVTFIAAEDLDQHADHGRERGPGTTIAESPSSSATIGAKANTMMTSLRATCESVKCGSPSERLLHTKTMAVQGAAARMIRPAM